MYVACSCACAPVFFFVAAVSAQLTLALRACPVTQDPRTVRPSWRLFQSGYRAVDSHHFEGARKTDCENVPCPAWKASAYLKSHRLSGDSGSLTSLIWKIGILKAPMRPSREVLRLPRVRDDPRMSKISLAALPCKWIPDVCLC